MKVKFSKMHGLGNDFVLINNLADSYNFLPQQIRQIAERKYGVGCDQVLILDQPTDGSSDYYYRIFNSDGSRAGQCGNGARCVIAYLYARGFSCQQPIYLQTAERVIAGGELADGRIWVNMGKPQIQGLEYQLEFSGKTLKFAALALGNPHAVFQLNAPEEFAKRDDLTAIASYLQSSSLFPDSVNVNFCYRADYASLRLLTYERGCGFTLACGSGACASAYYYLMQDASLARIKVQMPGGELVISLDAGEILMYGDAEHVFDGEIEL